ncbi:MAG: nucleoside kinase [Kiritimatiellia bacterium]
MKKVKTVADVLPAVDSDGRPVLGAMMNNMVVPLDTPLVGEPELAPLTRARPYGVDIHRSTLVFLLAKCASDAFPGTTFRVRHSIGPALWCTLAGKDAPLPADAVAKLRPALAALVKANRPIAAVPAPYREAYEFFERTGRLDELHLMKHRNPPMVLMTQCGAFRALNQTTLASRTGMVDLFDLIPVDDGIILNLPSLEKPDELVPLPYTEPYFKVFRRQRERTRVTGVETVGDLNQAVLEKRFDDLVRTVEAMQTKDLSRIADEIAMRNPPVRLVLLAGPSSAGKTTTAHRLCTQLRVDGMKPRLLSTDDYFVGDARNPRDANGRLDYEHVKAVDAERLAADLNALFAGKPVHLRRFDFLKHDGYDAKDATTLPPTGVIVLEGIHALNPELTRGIDDTVKFRVYLNALTQLVVDSCNRLSATDTRLLRRLVRDFNYRGMSPLETFRLWPGVVAGERKWIYPYQPQADAVFNSSLDYELAVLKPYATRLLNQVKPWDPEFVEARRLSGILHNVSVASEAAVPGNSILRETIGGSQLDY